MSTADYATLLQEVQPKVIRNEKAHRQALRWIDRWMKTPRKTAAERTLLDLLCKLVNDYEEEHSPTPKMAPADLLQHLAENQGLSQAEIGRATGIARSTLSEVMHGRRSVSVENAFRLGDYFSVEPSLFLTRP